MKKVISLFLTILLMHYISITNINADMVVVGGRFTRRIPTMISVYVKEGTIPNIKQGSWTYNGTSYTYLLIVPSEDTLIKVDYSEIPQYMTYLHRDIEGYEWVAAINGGYFNINTGEPIGAVRTDNEWQLYNGQYKYPDRNEGNATAFFDTCTFKISFSGLQDFGTYWEYKGNVGHWTDNDDPNRFEVGYSEAISGGYTLFINGEENNISPFGSRAYNYIGDSIESLSFFGSTMDNRILMVKTDARGIPYYNQFDFIRDICLSYGTEPKDIMRLDGGDSSQLYYDSNYVNLTDEMCGCKFTVTYLDYDGSVIKKYENVNVGETPIVPRNPTRNQEGNIVYTFESWDKEIAPVTSDQVYTAIYSQREKPYTYTFMDGNKILKRCYLDEGETPDISDLDYVYKWNRDIVPADGNHVYYALEPTIFDKIADFFKNLFK